MKKIPVAFPTNRLPSEQQILSAVDEVRRFSDQVYIVANGFAAEKAKLIRGAWDGLAKVEAASALGGRMAALRERSTRHIAQGEYVLLIDDDIIPRPGYAEDVADGVRYLDENPECGLILFATAFGSVGRGSTITPFRGRHVEMGLGMLLRKPHPLFPAGSRDYNGGGEEMLLAAWANHLGFYVAKKFCVRAVHRHLSSYELRRGAADRIHDLDLAERGCYKRAAQLFGVEVGALRTRPLVNRGWGFPPIRRQG